MAKKSKSSLFIGSLFIFLMTLQAHAYDVIKMENPDYVLGVFATNRTRASLLDKAFEQNILAYNINWKSEIDLENRVVKKVWTRQNGQWIRLQEVPLPSAVYDFGVYKNASDRKEAAKALVWQLRSQKIPFINPEKEDMPAVNDKILFAKIMIKNNIPHPETKNFSKRNLFKMLKKHQALYLKPTFGSKGYGIIIIEKTGKNYSIKYKTKESKKSLNWQSILKENISKKKLYKEIKEAKIAVKQPRARYLIQQGIATFDYENKLTDFRFNIQRGEEGALSVSGFQMRVGGNLAQGGRPATYKLVLKPLQNNTALPVEILKAKAQDTALNTFMAMEKNIGKNLGDLGIDIVLDTKGNPFVIEVNSKNGFMSAYLEKNPKVNDLFGLPSSLDDCYELDDAHENTILDYARYLAQEQIL